METLMCPGFREAGSFDFMSVGPFSIDLLEFDRVEHPEGAVTAAPVVEDHQMLEDLVGELGSRPPRRTIKKLDLHPDPNDSMTALSKQSPMEPIEGTSVERFARSVNDHEMNWSRDRCGSGRRGRAPGVDRDAERARDD